MPNRNRWIICLMITLLMVVLSGCGGGGSSSTGSIDGGGGNPPPGDGTPLPAKTLRWAAPTTYADSTPMNPLTDLDGFEIYVKQSSVFTDADTPKAVVSAVDPSTHTLSSSFNLANLDAYLSRGIVYYVSLRAVAITGLKSDFSPPASFSF